MNRSLYPVRTDLNVSYPDWPRAADPLRRKYLRKRGRLLLKKFRTPVVIRMQRKVYANLRPEPRAHNQYIRALKNFPP